MAHHPPYVSYAIPSYARRRAGSTVRRSSLLKAALAFVAALLAAALASADVPLVSSAPSPPPPWLLRAEPAAPPEPASRAEPAPRAEHATAPQERLPIVSGVSAALAPSATDASTAAGEAITPDDSPPASASAWAARLWRQLEALPLFMLLAGVAITAIILRGIAARSPQGAARPEGIVEVLARYPIGRRQQIVLMRVGRRVIVAHQADRAMRTLSETGDPDEVAELIAKAQAPGRDLFSRLLDRRRRKVDLFAEAELVDLTRERAAALPATERSR